MQLSQNPEHKHPQRVDWRDLFKKRYDDSGVVADCLSEEMVAFIATVEADARRAVFVEVLAATLPFLGVLPPDYLKRLANIQV